MSARKQPEGKPEGDPSEKKQFIRETIREMEKPSGKKTRVVVLLLVMAVLFGLIASFTFVMSEPWFRQLLGREEQETRENVQIPRDSVAEAETSTEDNDTAAPETAVAPEEEEAALQESLDQLVKSYFATWENDEEEPVYTDLVYQVSASLSHSMVTVQSHQSEEDVFQHQYVRSEETFGLVLTVTSQDVRILTEAYLLENAQSVHITLGNRAEYDASLVAMDRTTRMAVVSIPLASLDEASKLYIEPVTLGNSYACRSGDTVVALGNPMGYVPSAAWGIISYVNSMVQGMDMNFQLIQTDIAGSSDATGILVNTQGEIIGWITQRYNDSDKENMLAAISISDIKGLIERISNGAEMACLGVRIQVVTPLISEEGGVPRGLYISQCISGQPAYDAGLQNGDVLVEFDGQTIESISDLQDVLMQYEPGEILRATVMRSGRNGYAEQTFEVRLGER